MIENIEPGIPCPTSNCGHKIQYTVKDLIDGKVIKCQHCLVEFSMNEEGLKKRDSNHD
ncbi:hypothetical protein SHLI107390_15585 [Shewanella livingstonensis]